MKITKFVFCMLLCMAPLTTQAISLDEALIHAYKTNPELNAKREELKQQDEQIMQALAKWMPSITLQASKRYTEQKRIFNAISRTVENRSFDGRQHRIVVKQNLFRSGADIASIRAARSAIDSARAELINTEQDIFLKAIRAYMDAISTKEIYRIAQIRVRDNAKLLNGTKQRFKAGDASRTDVALAEAEFLQAQSGRATAEANYETSKGNFVAIVGVAPNNLTLPKTNVKLPKNLDETINTALIKNPNIINRKNTAAAAKKNIDVAKGGVLPNVDLEYTFSDNTDFGLSSFRGLRDHTTIISVSLPVLAVDRWSGVRQQKRFAARADYGISDTKNRVRAAAIQVWTDLKSQKTNLKAREAEYKARQIAYNGAKAAERAGLMSTLDVIRVQEDYFSTYINFVSIRSRYYVALYSLKSIVGQCTAKGLGLNTKYYDPLKNYNSIKWQLVGAF